MVTAGVEQVAVYYQGGHPVTFFDPDHPDVFYFGWQVDVSINNRNLSRARRKMLESIKGICRGPVATAGSNIARKSR